MDVLSASPPSSSAYCFPKLPNSTHSVNAVDDCALCVFLSLFLEVRARRKPGRPWACLSEGSRSNPVRSSDQCSTSACPYTTLAARWCVTTTNSFGELHPGVRCMEAQTGHVCVGDVACAEDRPELAERALSERSHDSSSYDSSQVFGVLEKPACR